MAEVKLKAGLMYADIHALLAWFDISFNAAHKPVQFSTGPHAKYTREPLGRIFSSQQDADRKTIL
jgi:hypothetical protein